MPDRWALVEAGLADLLRLGNKPDPYDAEDVRIAQAVADDVRLVMSRLREHSRDRATINLLNDNRTSLRVSTWEWDQATDVVVWGPDAAQMLDGTGCAVRGPRAARATDRSCAGS